MEKQTSDENLSDEESPNQLPDREHPELPLKPEPTDEANEVPGTPRSNAEHETQDHIVDIAKGNL